MLTEVIVAIAGGSLGAMATLVVGLHTKIKDRKETWWDQFTWAAEALESANKGTQNAAKEVLLGLSKDERAPLADRKAAEALLAEDPVTITIAGRTHTIR